MYPANAPQMPIPRPTELTKPFWDGCREGELRLQRCRMCGRRRFYPTASCPGCASEAVDWTPVTGLGRVYSWIVVRKTVDSYWRTRTPYVVAIVELEEQRALFVPGLLTGVSPDEVQPELKVEIWFDRTSPEVAIPRWRPR